MTIEEDRFGEVYEGHLLLYLISQLILSFRRQHGGIEGCNSKSRCPNNKDQKCPHCCNPRRVLVLPIPGRAPEDGKEPEPAGENQRRCIPSCIKGLVHSKGTDNLIRETNTFNSYKVQNQFSRASDARRFTASRFGSVIRQV